MARDKLLHTQHLIEPRLPLWHRCRPRFEFGGVGVTALARLAGRARLLPKLLRPVDGPHAGIFDRVEIFAFLDRRRTLFGVIERGLERGGRDFKVFRKATMSLISWSLNKPCPPQGGITVSGLKARRL